MPDTVSKQYLVQRLDPEPERTIHKECLVCPRYLCLMLDGYETASSGLRASLGGEGNHRGVSDLSLAVQHGHFPGEFILQVRAFLSQLLYLGRLGLQLPVIK